MIGGVYFLLTVVILAVVAVFALAITRWAERNSKSSRAEHHQVEVYSTCLGTLEELAIEHARMADVPDPFADIVLDEVRKARRLAVQPGKRKAV